MKPLKSYFMIGAIFFCTSFWSQKTIIRELDFQIKQYELTDKHKKQLIKYFNKLDTENELELILHTREEEKLGKQPYLIKATKIRAELISKYLLDNTIATQENFSIKYSKTKKTTKSGSNASYRKFTNHQVSPITLIVTKSLASKIFTSNELIDTTFNYNTLKTCDSILDEYDRGHYIYGNNYLIYIPYEAIDTKTCKDCEITVKHNFFFSKEDFINRNLTSTSSGQILISAGMAYIDIYCGSTKIKIRDNKKIKLYFNNWEAADEEYHVFSGNKKKHYINWDKTKDEVDNYGNNFDGEGEMEYSFMMEVSNLGWINCDAFYEVKEKTNLVVKTEMKYKPSVRMIFTKMNSILPGYVMGISNNVHFENIPKGEEVYVLSYALSKDKEKVKWAMQAVTLGEDEKIEMKLENTSSVKEFKLMLKKKI